jgi:hypothetical protein
MNTETAATDPLSPRDEALLRNLEALATAGPTMPRRRWTPSRAVAAAALAFTLAGAGAGALTAGALVRASDSSISPVQSTMQTFALGSVEDAHVVGSAQFFDGSGTTQLHIGDKPSGNVSLVVEFWCLSSGKSSLMVDGHKLDMGSVNGLDQSDCSAPAPQPQSASVISRRFGALSTPSLTVTGTGHFAIWASWVAQPAMATPSDAQKAAIADNVITRAEYLAGWARVEGCMDAAGHPIGEVPQNELVFQYGVSSSDTAAFDFSCYPREVQDVDVLWQGQVFNRGNACLTAHGDSAPTAGELMENALEAANLTPEECGIE